MKIILTDDELDALVRMYPKEKDIKNPQFPCERDGCDECPLRPWVNAIEELEKENPYYFDFTCYTVGAWIMKLLEMELYDNPEKEDKNLPAPGFVTKKKCASCAHGSYHSDDYICNKHHFIIALKGDIFGMHETYCDDYEYQWLKFHGENI